ncbi:peptidase S8 [Micromonospora thermarum]|uniref:Peptidase S8 n=1 Tax=Micromonospora thermarum TaxID=2720024 RepID=A0ABX0Z8V3_9ACTN|nr:peptidase S8 [Micromonospora thermarum]NJP33558.1 peptidase S8 [Micromonospora thermarum]
MPGRPQSARVRRTGTTLAGRLVAVGSAVALMLGGQPAHGGARPAAPPPAPAASITPPEHAAEPTYEVTLITGDRVRTSADGTRVTVTRAPGRDGIRFSSYGTAAHRYVVPEDARPLVTDGLLDRRLFDVTGLVRAGYHDARRADLPLVVAGGADLPGVRAVRRPDAAGATAAVLPKSDAGRAWRAISSGAAGIGRISLDAPRVDPATSPAGRTGRAPASTTQETETHQLTVAHLDAAGAPTTRAETTVFDRAGEIRAVLHGTGDTATVRLPKGDYVLVGDVVDFGRPDAPWYRLVQPRLTLDRDAAVTVDARRAAPVTTTVPRAEARPVLVELGFDRPAADGAGFRLSLIADDFVGLHAGHLGPEVAAEELTSYLSSTWAVPGARGDFRNSPFTYGLLDTRRGSFFTGFQRRVSDAGLATVNSRLNQQVPGRQATKSLFSIAPGVTGTVGSLLPYDLPARVTHHLDASPVEWSAAFGENRPDGSGLPAEVTALGQGYQTYQAGRAYSDRWNAAAFGPLLDFAGHAGRQGDRMWFGVPMFSDQDGHRGGSLTDSASTRLYRGDQLVGESAAVDVTATVAPGPAAFRVEKRTTRPSISGLSTRIDATWTFRSEGSGAGTEWLPIWVVRYAPTVDDRNQSRATPVTVLPVTLIAQPEARVGTVRRLTVQVSGDQGRTWRSALVVPAGDRAYRAVFRTPSGATTVSLRATLVDSHGNRLTQTIINAYPLVR